MAKFVTIGERLSTTAPAVNKAFTERDPEPIIKRAKQQLDAGATYLDVNIGPAENDGEDLMKWAVQLLQSEFDNVPLALDTTNQKAIEAGISVYNRSKGKPIVNSADAGDRISNIDLAAANDAICIALCSSGMVASDNDERMMHCQNMLERGLATSATPPARGRKSTAAAKIAAAWPRSRAKIWMQTTRNTRSFCGACAGCRG